MAAPPEDPFQAALRRAMERAEEVRRTLGVAEVPPKVAFELRRKALHVFVAVVAVPMLLLLPFRFSLTLAIGAILIISSTWAIERRRMQHLLLPPYKEHVHKHLAGALERTRRPHEDFPWSPVLYTASLIILGLAHEYLDVSWTIIFAAYAILGIGDAASALVGVAYGRTKLPWNRSKSVEGLLAGLVTGFFAGVVMSALPFAFAGVLYPIPFFAIVLTGATAGAFAESLPGVEDNFVVPLAAAAAMWALSLILGLALP